MTNFTNEQIATLASTPEGIDLITKLLGSLDEEIAAKDEVIAANADIINSYKAEVVLLDKLLALKS